MKCICQICSCGKHRCPHYMPKRPVSKQPCMLTTTEYQGEYKPGPGEKKVIHKPKDNLKQDGTTDYNTTHKDIYHPHELQQRSSHKPQEVYTKRSDDMDLNTEYGTKYQKGRGETIPLPSYFQKKTQLFDQGKDIVDKSVTQEDYHKKSQNGRPINYKVKDTVAISTAPFDSKSIHQSDFQKFDRLGRVVPKRPDNIDTKGLPGYYDTTHGDHYLHHKQRPRSSKAIQDQYRPNDKPFDGQSLMQTDYKPHHGVQKQGMVNQDSGLFETDDRFNDETTNYSTYKKWDVQKNNVKREQSQYSRPTEGMDLQTTSADYKNFGGRRAAHSMRPKTNVNFGEEFDGLSSYQDKYVKHDISPRTKYKGDRGDYYASDAPFNTISENQDKYQRFTGIAPAQMVHHDNDMFGTDQPLQNKTSYGDHYDGKKLPDCPSTKIVSNDFKGYDLIDDFITGHRFLIKNGDGSSASSSASSTFRGKESPLPPIGGGGNTQVFVAVK